MISQFTRDLLLAHCLRSVLRVWPKMPMKASIAIYGANAQKLGTLLRQASYSAAICGYRSCRSVKFWRRISTSTKVSKISPSKVSQQIILLIRDKRRMYLAWRKSNDKFQAYRQKLRMLKIYREEKLKEQERNSHLWSRRVLR